MLKFQTLYKGQMRITDSIKNPDGSTTPCLVGQVSSEEIVSQNGYRYRKGFWKKVLEREPVISAIQNRDMFGMIEHPKDDDAFMNTPYEGASHVVMQAWIDAKSGNPFAKLGLLNNTHGNSIKALLDVGHNPGVSTRGMGNFDNDGVSQFVKEDDYMFLTWDIVRNPNFADLKMEAVPVTDSLMKNPIFTQMLDMYQLRDSADEHYNKLSLQNELDSAITALTNIKNFLYNSKK